MTVPSEYPRDPDPCAAVPVPLSSSATRNQSLVGVSAASCTRTSVPHFGIPLLRNAYDLILQKNGGVTDNRIVDSILRALGAAKPLPRRCWVSERTLSSIVRDRRDLVEVLEHLARDPQIRLRARGTGSERQWFLDQGKLKVTRHEVAPREATEAGDPTCTPDDDDEEEVLLDTASMPPRLSRLPADPRFGALRGTTQPSLPAQVRHQGRQPDPSKSSDVWQVLRDLGVTVSEDSPQPKTGHGGIRHYLALAPGERMESLRRCIEDIGRAFGCEAYVCNLPGERFVALDLARPDRKILPLLPAIEALPVPMPGDLWLPIGMAPDGKRTALDLSTLPHILIAGTTGSGKTIWLLCAVIALALRLSAEQLELILIDIKAVDFMALARLPHLHGRGVITDADSAIAALQNLTGPELERRTNMLRQAGCANLTELHAKCPNHGVKRTVVVIDELGDLVTVLSKEDRQQFEREVLRLAQRARSVGIHLVIATQRPTREFITGSIKANLPCRISFRLPQKNDSLVILDQPGAERLLGLGDMLLFHDGQTRRLQGYYTEVRQASDLATLQSRFVQMCSSGKAQIGESIGTKQCP